MTNFAAMKLVYSIFISLLFFTSCNSGPSTAEGLFEAGRFEEAAEAYTTQIEQSGNDLDLIYNRGRSYEEMGSLSAATKDYNYILDKDPKHLNALLSLSKMAYEKGDYAKSLLMSEEAKKNHETSPQAHFLIARAKHQLGYTKAALEAYNNAISLDKEFGEAYLYRGALRSAMKHKRACEDFKTASVLKVEGASEAIEKYCS